MTGLNIIYVVLFSFLCALFASVVKIFKKESYNQSFIQRA